jgi:hypothetical protein
MRTMKFCLFVFFALINATTPAQITVTPIANTDSAAAAGIVDMLVGSSLTWSNASFVGTPMLIAHNGGFASNVGVFADGDATGIAAGIIFSTGNVMDCGDSNRLNNTSYSWGFTTMDADLATLSTGTTMDGIGLKFDFVPDSNMITFRYVFASDEYNEYVGSEFNDVFGFFINGPNPCGGFYQGENIARLTNGNPVAINNVNNGASAAYFRDNQNSLIEIECDGLTTVLIAKIRVVPQETYSLKMIIADVSDNILDSWVFIESGSFSNINIVESPILYLGPDLELCYDEDVVLDASNEFEFYEWSTGQTTQTISAGHSTQDYGIGLYSVKVLDKSGCYQRDTVEINVLPPVNITPGADTVLCSNASILLSADTGFSSYTWSTGEQSPVISVDSSVASGNSVSIVLTATNGPGCISSDSVLVVFSVCSETGENTPSGVVVFYNSETDKLFFDVSKSLSETQIEVWAVDGKCVHKTRSDSKRNVEIDCSAFSTGIYMYKLYSENKVFTGKFAKAGKP